MRTIYAVFNNQQTARLAQQSLRHRLGEGAQITLVDQPERLSHHVVPLQMTQARGGVFIGSLVVAFVSALALGAGLLAMTAFGFDPIPTPGATLALSVVFAAIFGGLAGALAFSSDSKTLLRRLRLHIQHHHPVVLVRDEKHRGPEQVERELELFGPITVGAVS
jgi:hypothetical protein